MPKCEICGVTPQHNCIQCRDHVCSGCSVQCCDCGGHLCLICAFIVDWQEVEATEEERSALQSHLRGSRR